MRPTFLLVVMLVSVLGAYGDEPPSWAPFRVCTEAERYCADVAPVTESGEPWNVEWRVTVSEKGSSGSLWETGFRPSGYDGGMLAEDGSAFVVVSFWYYSDTPVVTIYRADGRFEFSGRGGLQRPRQDR